MFLIAKIVRGRRLLHELEQSEKEKEREREREQKAAAALAETLSNASQKDDQRHDSTGGRRRVPAKKKSVQYDLQATTSGEANAQQQHELAIRRRKKALRQKTEISLGIDKGDGSPHQRIRRTSSMPSVVEALNRAVTMTEKLRHYNYDVKLNKLQKRALRFTWHRLHTRNGGKRVETVFEEIYDRLMRVLPSMREMFNTRTFLSAMSKQDVATLRDHARFTTKMFDTVIKNLDTEDKKRTDTLSEFDPFLIGKAHTCLRSYRFVSSFWEKLGEIIIDVVLIQEAVRDLPGAGQAWVVLTACVIDQLRAGFEQRETAPRQHQRCPVLSQQHTNNHQQQKVQQNIDLEQKAQLTQQYENQQQKSNSNPTHSSPTKNSCPFHVNANFKYADETPGTDEEGHSLNGSTVLNDNYHQQNDNYNQQMYHRQQQQAAYISHQQKRSSRNSSADRLTNASMSDEENIQYIQMPQTGTRNSLPGPTKVPAIHMQSVDYHNQLLSPYNNHFISVGKQYCSSDNLSVNSDSTLCTSRRGSQPAPLRNDTTLYRSSIDNSL